MQNHATSQLIAHNLDRKFLPLTIFHTFNHIHLYSLSHNRKQVISYVYNIITYISDRIFIWNACTKYLKIIVLHDYELQLDLIEWQCLINLVQINCKTYPLQPSHKEVVFFFFFAFVICGRKVPIANEQFSTSGC